MSLPKITFSILNGQLGQTLQTEDGVAAMILSGQSVSAKVQINIPYLFTSLKACEDFGITSAGVNAFAHKQVSDFFEIAGTGSKLYLMITSSSIDSAVDEVEGLATALLDYADGSIRLLAVSVVKPGSPTITNGLQAEVHTAATNAQALADTYAAGYKPLRVLLDGVAYDGTVANLKDYKTTDYNRVAILLSGESNAGNADVGSALGLLASLPVQRKMSRVANGAVQGMDTAYLTDGETVSENASDWDAIHAKGYIFHRTHVGKSGFFFSSDVTCTADTDDYNSLAKGRVIDKAIILAYGVLLEKLSGEVEIDADGTIPVAICKDWQGEIDTTIGNAMIANGEASGVETLIDPDQNVLSTNKVSVSLRILPVGYSDFIDVELGFTTQTT